MVIVYVCIDYDEEKYEFVFEKSLFLYVKFEINIVFLYLVDGLLWIKLFRDKSFIYIFLFFLGV